MAPGRLPHEARQRRGRLAAQRGPGVHQPPEGAPKVAQRLKGGDGGALAGIRPHHFHDHLVDEPWKHLHDGRVFILGRKDVPSNEAHLLAELALPLRLGRRMCLVDPNGQEELEAGLVGVLAQATIIRLLGQQLRRRAQVLALPADPHSQHGLRI